MDNAQQQAFKAFSLYLPYRLSMLFEKSGKIIELNGLLNSKTLVITATNGHNYDYAVWNFKPLLIPLSKLTDELFNESGFADEEDLINCIISGDIYNKYWLKLVENHYDVVDLRSKGLALNKLDYIK